MVLTNCTTCGAALPLAGKFCSSCGTPISSMTLSQDSIASLRPKTSTPPSPPSQEVRLPRGDGTPSSPLAFERKTAPTKGKSNSHILTTPKEHAAKLHDMRELEAIIARLKVTDWALTPKKTAVTGKACCDWLIKTQHEVHSREDAVLLGTELVTSGFLIHVGGPLTFKDDAEIQYKFAESPVSIAAMKSASRTRQRSHTLGSVSAFSSSPPIHPKKMSGLKKGRKKLSGIKKHVHTRSRGDSFASDIDNGMSGVSLPLNNFGASKQKLPGWKTQKYGSLEECLDAMAKYGEMDVSAASLKSTTRYVCVEKYVPKLADELPLEVGDEVTILEKPSYSAQYWRGYVKATGDVGFFKFSHIKDQNAIST